MIIPNVTYHEQESGPAEVERTDQLGKETFLRILLAQLSHQDPLNPMDSLEFTSQLSQFSELEQMIGLNEKLDRFLESQTSLNNWDGVAMIGKEVDVAGNWVELTDGEAGTFGFHVGQSLAQVSVEILDPAGNVVRTLPYGAVGRGDHLVRWDGRDGDGKTLADGFYGVRVAAGGHPATDAVQTFVRGMITGVSFVDGEASLLLDDMTIPFADVMAVRSVSEE